jgi:hypothetical protein
VVVVNHRNQPKLQFSLFKLVRILWLWLMVGRSFKLQSIIGLGLGFERKLVIIILLALDCSVKVVVSTLS